MKLISTVPQCVRNVLDKPGLYRFDQPAFYWYFEVTQAGRVYQLDPRTGKRDGLLSDDGWSEHAEAGKVVPVKNVGEAP